VTVDLSQTESDPRCTDHLAPGLCYCHFLFPSPVRQSLYRPFCALVARVAFIHHHRRWYHRFRLSSSLPSYRFTCPKQVYRLGRRRHIPVEPWSSLAESCLLRSIIPPLLTNPTPIPATPSVKAINAISPAAYRFRLFSPLPAPSV
jgi:hypothetical protein